MEEGSCGGVIILPGNNFREAKLEEIHKKVIETKQSDIQLQAILLKKNKEKQEIWSVSDLRITESLAKRIQEIVLNYIRTCAENEIKDFMVSNDQSDEYLIERLAESDIPVLSKIISEMRRDDNDDISFNKLTHISYLKGFAITFSPDLVVFNKVTKTNLLFPKRYLYFFPSATGEFTEIEEQNLISMPMSVDTILYGDPLYIFNRNHFIQLFRYEDAFDHFITAATPSLKKIVNDLSLLINGSKPDMKKYRRLASACAGYVDRIVQNKVDLEPISKDYGFNITFYNGLIKMQNSIIGDVLKLLNGQAVKDAIFGEKYLAQEKTKV